jgi:hypothetical protein
MEVLRSGWALPGWGSELLWVDAHTHAMLWIGVDPNGQLRSSGGQESLPKLRGDLWFWPGPNWVQFLIKDGSIMLTKAYPEFPVSEVANWSDEKLRQKLEVVTGGLVRKAA